MKQRMAMPSNYWEELDMSYDVLEFHEEELGRWDIPKWMKLNCPNCNKELPLRSIRSVSLRFNTRNMGDIAVEVCCNKCLTLDTVYFRQEANNIKDLIPFLTGEKEPKNIPIAEQKMYKMQYNNAVEKMLDVKGGKNVDI